MPSFNIKDMAAGAIFAVIGIAFMTGALLLPLGTALRMGPGFFPMILSGILIMLGVVIMARSINLPSEAIGAVPWRGIVLILVAPIVFGATVRGLGLIFALPLTTFIAAMASRRIGLRVAIILSAGLTIFCVLIFSYGLGLPLPLIGRWLRI